MIASSRPQPAKGFSLVETTIAFGIVAVTLVSVMALMGGVLTTSGETIDRFATARIFQGIAEDFQMKEWESIEETDKEEADLLYFDEKGEAVKKSDAGAVYVGKILLLDPPDFPGISSKAKAKLNERPERLKESRRVKVELSTQLNSSDPFKNRRFVREFSTLIVKLDK